MAIYTKKLPDNGGKYAITQTITDKKLSPAAKSRGKQKLIDRSVIKPCRQSRKAPSFP